MALSVQQIKFDLLSYIKEFGGDAACWFIGVSEDAATELFENLGVDRSADVWLWKPAASPKAAKLVTQWMIDRRKVSAVQKVCDGSCIFIYKRKKTMNRRVRSS